MNKGLTELWDINGVDAYLDCSEHFAADRGMLGHEVCTIGWPIERGSRTYAWRTTNCQLRATSAIRRSIHRRDPTSLPADMDTHPCLVVGLGYSEGSRVHWSEPCDPVEDERIFVIGNWQYIGRGHPPREAIFTRTIADDLAENRRALRQAPWTERME
jgi:hypothetical protein